jgi:hypothetical protein
MRTKLFLTLGVAAMASMSQAIIIFDQIPVNEADQDELYNTQDYETSNNAFDIVTIDDFNASNPNLLSITRVEALLGGFSGFIDPIQWSAVTGFRVEIYSSAAAALASLTGDVASALIPAGSATLTDLGWASYGGTARLVSMNVNMTLPGTGTYWVGVRGVLDATASFRQIGVANNLVVNGGDNATMVNPGGGFGIPGNSGFPPVPGNAAYRLHAVPEPGSMIALGLGAAALLARRRRKAA